MPNPIDVQKSLSGVNYPATKTVLIERARYNGADEDVLDDLGKLPEQQYGGPDEVQKAMF